MPALDWISVEGFKSIAGIERLPLGPLNVLIGANGSGKSNFMEVFPFLDAVWNGALDDYVRQEGGADRILHYGSKTTRKITVGLSFEGGHEHRIEIEADGSDGLRLNGIDAVGENAHPSADDPASAYLPNRVRRADTGSGIDRADADCARKRFPDWRVHRFEVTGKTSPMRRSGDVADNLYLRPDGSNIAAYLHFLRNEHETRYDYIRRVIQLLVPFFDDFHLEPQAPDKNTIGLAWRDRKSGSCFDASYLSDGTLRFMALAILLAQPESLQPSVIILDEPEIGMHPYGKVLVASLVRSASKSSQILLATQSARLVDDFGPEDLIVADRVDGATELARLNPKDLKKRLREYTLGEIWEKNEFRGQPAPKHDERPVEL